MLEAASKEKKSLSSYFKELKDCQLSQKLHETRGTPSLENYHLVQVSLQDLTLDLRV